MAAFDITMKHTEESLEALAHMQYDLFCRSNRVVRTILATAPGPLMPSPMNPTLTVSIGSQRNATISSCPAGRSGTGVLIRPPSSEEQQQSNEIAAIADAISPVNLVIRLSG